MTLLSGPCVGIANMELVTQDLEEMLTERGVEVDHSTIYRWVQYYAPKILDKLKWYWKPKLGYSWRVDETYIKVKGRWTYLYRALDKSGNTIDFYLVYQLATLRQLSVFCAKL